ncbi:MAG: hypothetical protein ABI461_22670, partial [Polyangiaceae bacterium]
MAACVDVTSPAAPPPAETKVASEPLALTSSLASPKTTDSAPTETSPAPPAPRSPFAYANIDPADDMIVAPPERRANCEA